MDATQLHTDTDSQVEVHFWSALGDEYRMAGESDRFMVPTKLARYGLSEVVNHVLERTPESSQPFEFLINGEILRGTLQAYMERNVVTSELTLSIEYTLARSRPRAEELDKQPDWIAKIRCLLPNKSCAEDQAVVTVTACMDSMWRLYTGPSSVDQQQPATSVVELKQSVAVGKLPLSSIIPIRPGNCSQLDGQAVEVCTGNRSGLVAFYGINTATGVYSELASGSSHGDAVHALAVNKDTALVASAGADRSIKIWNNSEIANYMADWCASEEYSAKSRRVHRKRRMQTTRTVQPRGVIDAACDASILDMQFMDRSVASILTASADKTVRVFDALSESQVVLFPVARAVNSVDACKLNRNICCTAHDDCIVRIWDIRTSDNVTHAVGSQSIFDLQSSYNAHSRMTTEARWSPFESHLLASAAHDGNVNVFDIRLPKLPLHSVPVKGNDNQTEHVKLLSLQWSGESSLLVGGSDGVLRRLVFD
eukprot:Lankesteria_metandrocarpae@DN4788_c0_g1_i1.p1